VAEARKAGIGGHRTGPAHVQVQSLLAYARSPCMHSCTRLRPKSNNSAIFSCKQVAGETEVKAQIKMRLTPTSGVPIVVIRSFQLQQKKSSLQFKAIDQVWSTAKGHEPLACSQFVHSLYNRDLLSPTIFILLNTHKTSRRITSRRWLGLSRCSWRHRLVANVALLLLVCVESFAVRSRR